MTQIEGIIDVELVEIEELEGKIAPDSGSVPVID
jgi:hypothetical protein